MCWFAANCNNYGIISNNNNNAQKSPTGFHHVAIQILVNLGITTLIYPGLIDEII